MPDKTVGVILGGGVGQRLAPLTKVRSKPAVPFGGKYRLIDVPISNCLNAGIRRIFVLTQFNSASLNGHITHTFRFDSFGRSFVDILAAEQTLERKTWFQGTADAVRANLRHIVNRPGVDYVLILGGDQLYRMHFGDVVAQHTASGADVTVAVTKVEREDASRYGILRIDENREVTKFVEKPKEDALDDLKSDDGFLGSMGIYVFNRNVLEEELTQSDANDFGHGILPGLLGRRRLFAYVFEGYFEDVGTIATFYQANLDLTDPLPRFNFYEPLAPIYTRPRFLPGSKVDDCTIVRSLITEGVILDRCRIERSVVGIRARIQKGATVKESLIMGADFYQLQDDIKKDRESGTPPIGIGEDALVKKAIIDKNARIGAGVRILNANNIDEADGENYYIRDGIVVIPKDVVVPDGTVI